MSGAAQRAADSGGHRTRTRSAAAPFTVQGVRFVSWIEADGYVWESTCGRMRAWRVAQWFEHIAGKPFERRRYRASRNWQPAGGTYASLSEAMAAAVMAR